MSGARSGVAHAMVSCSYCDTDTGNGRQRAPPGVASDRALHAEVYAHQQNAAAVDVFTVSAQLADRGAGQCH